MEVPMDDRQRNESPSEGVRIIGADEARSVLEGQDQEEEETAETALPPTPSATVRISTTPTDEPSGPISLPHWTEPPTGEVPVINADGTVDMQTESDDELQAWASLADSAPRFRSESADWNEGDFKEGETLQDDTMAMGALSQEQPDDDQRFARDVAAKRRSAKTTGQKTGPQKPREQRPQLQSSMTPDALGTRMLTAAVLGVIGLVAFAIGVTTALAFVAIVMAVASFEVFSVLSQRGFRPAALLGIIASAAMPIAAYHRGERAYPVMIVVMLVFTFAWYLSGVVKARPVVNIGVTMLVFSWIGLLGGFAGLGLAAPDGLGIVLGGVLCAVAADIASFFVGAQFGSSQLAPQVSPGKTLEGAIGGFLASIVVSAIVVAQIAPWDESFLNAIALGAAVGIVAPLGDLCESLVKRDLGIKDFSTLLPGHGGVADRFDAILFALPVAYYLAIAFAK